MKMQELILSVPFIHSSRVVLSILGSPGMGGQTQTILRSHRTQPYTSVLSDFFLLSLTEYDSLKFVCCFFFCFFFLFKLLVCMRLLLDECSSWVRDALKLFMLLDPIQYFHFKDQKTEVERRWTLSKLIQLGRVQTQALQLQSTPVIPWTRGGLWPDKSGMFLLAFWVQMMDMPSACLKERI